MASQNNLAAGFYELADTTTHTNVIAYMDGTSWWMPGSELAFQSDSVAFEGQNEDGRFHFVRRIGVNNSAYGRWNVESGRIR